MDQNGYFSRFTGTNEERLNPDADFQPLHREILRTLQEHTLLKINAPAIPQGMAPIRNMTILEDK